jgi:trk system potassium uptake protein
MSRERKHLKQRYAAIFSSTGLVLILGGGLMLTPLLILPAFPGEAIDIPAFLIPAAILGFGGIGLRKFFHPGSGVTLSVSEGGVIVVISWVLVNLFSALPYMWTEELSFSQAVFESVSGWTTTGLTVVSVSHAGPMVLIWRSITQLAGGAGLAIIMMSAIVGPTGIGVSSAEGRADQLVPHVRGSARLVLIIYAGYAGAGTLGYWATGMSLFDAVNHSFAAVSTGGFSTHSENLAYWDSPAVEAVSIPLMLMGNLSFVTAWALLRGQIRSVIRNSEVRVMAMLIPFSAMAVMLFTCQSLYPRITKVMRVSIFETISALTTTGFQTVGYGNWNDFGLMTLILLMLIGGGTCSTAGGIKQFRLYLLWKLLGWEIIRSILPRTAVMACFTWESNGRVFVDETRIRQLSVFIFLYSTAYIAGVLVLCACGYDLKHSLFEFASAIGNAGLSVGVTTPEMPLAGMWAMTLAMFLGRLEFFVVIVGAVKIAKDVRRMLA